MAATCLLDKDCPAPLSSNVSVRANALGSWGGMLARPQVTLMPWSRDLTVTTTSPDPSPTRSTHLVGALYRRTRGSRVCSERATLHLVSEVHRVEGGGPSSGQERTASTRGCRLGSEPQPEAQMFFQISSKVSTCLEGPPRRPGTERGGYIPG